MACFIKEMSNNHRKISGVSDILMKIPPNIIHGMSKKLVRIVLNYEHIIEKKLTLAITVNAINIL